MEYDDSELYRVSNKRKKIFKEPLPSFLKKKVPLTREEESYK
jgi:hypothetical protein